MNTSALLFIILIYWIFTLQSKIKHLEKLVYGLKDKALDTTKKEDHTDKSHVAVDIQKSQSSIQVFKEQHESVEIKDEFKKPVQPQRLKSDEPSKFVAFITNYFTGGNLLVRIGGVILFFGLAFLVKYAAEHSIISMEVRLMSIALIAIMLMVVGWKLRDKKGAYGQILQGLGIATLYLVIYAASKFYTMLSLDIAFVLMLLVVIIGSVLAIMEDALPLALFASAGGFLVPILTSTGDGSHVTLFSYYVLLNLGIFIVAWYRSWRILNLFGFLFTFIIATTWGVLRYRSDLFSTTEPFLILFFLMYLSISILFTLKHPFKPRNLVDGTLVFGLPLFAFPLQVNVVKTFEYGEAYSAVILGTLYLMLFYAFRKKTHTALLAQSFLALGIVFYTIAIPYIFDADVSAALWSLESAAIIWLSLKQEKTYTRYFGECLLLLSMLVYPMDVGDYRIKLSQYLGYIIIILSALSAAYLLDRDKEKLSFDVHLSKILMGLSLLLWFISTPDQLKQLHLHDMDAFFFSLSLGALLLFVVSKRLEWRLAEQTLQGYTFLGLLFFSTAVVDTYHIFQPFKAYGAFSLGLFVTLSYLFVYRYEKVWHFTKQIHILTLWFTATVLTLEFQYHTNLLDVHKSFMMIALALPSLLLSILLLTPKRYIGWLESHRSTYQHIGIGGLAVMLLFWELKTFAIAPFSSPSYVPLFNPLDMMQALTLGVVTYWIYKNKDTLSVRTQLALYGITALLSTLFASVVFARAVHMFRDVSYAFNALWKDIYFQAGLSILWSTIAIILMLLSKRYQNRPAWMAGFGLLIVVVLKLFFVELASSGSIERIISFIVVGSLLLLIGYFVPLPPNNNEKSQSHEN